jgi:hypothetical protein
VNFLTDGIRRRAHQCVLGALLLVGCSDDTAPNRQPDAGGWGVMSDSQADEYRADDDRGGPYKATTLNWVELLAQFRNVDFGPWGNRAPPRRSGYEYNWALSGATSYTLISAGQHTGLAEQVEAGLVDNVFMQIGANDFAEAGIYDEIYGGELAGAELQAELDRIYANITLALKTVRDAGPDNLFWATTPDRGVGPVYVAKFPSAAGRQLVTSAINALNSRVAAYASSQGIIVIDVAQFGAALFTQIDSQGRLNVGGELIDFLTTGDEPHHVVLGDETHAGTVVSGLMANFYIDAFNARGFAIAKFSNQEILQNAGLNR